MKFSNDVKVSELERLEGLSDAIIRTIFGFHDVIM